ncbi:hypothetical protein BIV57_21105 [Mangrovactinospora gilvigrisea]|uniref:Solute-binding protein family 3/N-terminal domain-containing protein n=1 Tax=Mangrovactinospora gilvigrisea TaxID=1428644 RepID=A0A1J7BA17_9ACTN|nr:ABC transporter substrate-binding protein [Mangrovactinospora gilvigrisea]OIV35499.1 hypothetical protein BIV57_21105 [Mangrovactinospora gilvigrisea]
MNTTRIGTVRPRLAAAAALAASGALVLAACGSSGGGGGGKATGSGRPAGSSAPLFSKLPAKYQQSKTVTVGSNVAYAPNEFYGTDGKTIMGFDPDMGTAIGKELGVTFKFVNYDFDGLIPALTTGRINAIMSSMSDNRLRQKKIDFVDYFNVGTSILVAKGNPKHINSTADLCGRTVALQKGTIQESYVQDLQPKCKAAGKPLKLIALLNDTDALLQLKQGRSDADLNDYPVAQYNAQKSGGEYQVTGQQIQPGVYGIGVGKQDTQLRDAIQAAVKAIIANGQYAKVAAKWHLDKGEITAAQALVNGGTASGS